MFWHCPIKKLTGYPCPGCGTTRAVGFLFEGKIGEALYTNPLGLFVCVVLAVMAIAALYDLISGKHLYKAIFVTPFIQLKKKHKWAYIAMLALCFILAALNACWNYYKRL